MNALQYTDNSSDLNDLKLVSTEKPKCAPGLAVVKVVAASGNPIDVKVMQGHLKAAGWAMPLPFTAGYDVAGVVESVDDSDKEKFAAGDEVFAVNWGRNKHDEDDLPVGGTFAEYALVPVKRLSRKPEGLSFEQAAAVALVGTTAHQCLFDCAKATAGSRVLVLGGASAVGAIAIQLAKLRGAWVATTCSTRGLPYVTPLGADKVVNYREEQWESDAELKNLDAVIDTVGESNAFARCNDNGVIKEGGCFVSIAGYDAGFDPTAHAPKLSFGSFFCLYNNPAVQDELASLVVEGKLRVAIDKTFPFGEQGGRDLLKYIESGASQGKNVIRLA